MKRMSVPVTMICVVAFSLVAYAAKGPCVWTENPWTADRIKCTDKKCSGQVFIFTGVQECRNVNEFDCFTTRPAASITYQVTPSACTSPAHCGLDYSSRTYAPLIYEVACD